MSEDERLNKKDRITILFLTIYAFVVTIGGFFIIQSGNFSVIAWWILVFSGLYLFMYWHRCNYVYECKKCGAKFNSSVFEVIISPYSLYSRGLKCPKCKKIRWAREVSKD